AAAASLVERFLTPRISSSVQNGSVHQKDGLNDDDFEPYLSPQARPSRFLSQLSTQQVFSSAVLCKDLLAVAQPWAFQLSVK
uniref:Uncharacterized protein n=1 Tax=Pavo cristatus TaxID=9049 RepID=A0A8C9ESG1_PAVCR